MKLDTLETDVQEEKIERKRYTVLMILILSICVVPVILISLFQKAEPTDIAAHVVLSVLGSFLLLFYISIEPEGILEKAYSPWLIGICMFIYLMAVQLGNGTPWIMTGLLGAILSARLLNRNLGLFILFSQLPYLLFSGITSDKLLYFLLTGMLLCLLTGQADSLINLVYSCIMAIALQLTLIIVQNGFDISEIFSSGYLFMLLIGIGLLPVVYVLLCLFPEEKETVSMEILDETLMQEFMRSKENNTKLDETLYGDFSDSEHQEPETSQDISEVIKQKVRESVFSIPEQESKPQSADRLSELIRSFKPSSPPENKNPLEHLFQEMNTRKAAEKNDSLSENIDFSDLLDIDEEVMESQDYEEFIQTEELVESEETIEEETYIELNSSEVVEEWKLDLSESAPELQNAWDMLQDIIKTDDLQQMHLEIPEPEPVILETAMPISELEAEEYNVAEESEAEEPLILEPEAEEYIEPEESETEELLILAPEVEEYNEPEEPETEELLILEPEVEEYNAAEEPEAEELLILEPEVNEYNEAEELLTFEPEVKEYNAVEEPEAEELLNLEPEAEELFKADETEVEESIIFKPKVEEPVAQEVLQESLDRPVKLLDLLNKKREDDLLKADESTIDAVLTSESNPKKKVKQDSAEEDKRKAKKRTKKTVRKSLKKQPTEKNAVDELIQGDEPMLGFNTVSEIESVDNNTEIEIPAAEVLQEEQIIEIPDHTLMEVVQPDFPLLLKMQKESPRMYLQCKKIADISSRAIEVIDGDKELVFAGGMYCKLHKLSDGTKTMNLRMILSENRMPMPLILLMLQFAASEKPNSREMAVISITEDILSAIAYTKLKSDKIVSNDKIIDNVFKLRYSQKLFENAGMSIKEYTGLKRFFNAEFED